MCENITLISVMKFKSFKNSFKSRSGQPSGKDEEEKGRRVNKGSLRSRVEEKKLLKKTPSTPPKLPSSIDYELLGTVHRYFEFKHFFLLNTFKIVIRIIYLQFHYLSII